MVQPVTRWARAGDVNIAYQVVGDGPVDLVWAYGLGSNLEVFWEEPSLAALFRRFSEFSRLILFDRRGSGLSDRHGAAITPTLEERMDDILAVLDAVGSERASFFGTSEGGSLSALFAATHPERTGSIVLYGTPSRYEMDAAIGDSTMAEFAETIARGWGAPSEWGVERFAPSMVGDEAFTHWLAKWCRQSVSRGAIVPLLMEAEAYNLADVLPTVRVPTLVLHRRGDSLVPVANAHYTASKIPDARLVELDGIDHLPFVGDTEAVIAEVEDFLVGSRASEPRQRRLVTLSFVEIDHTTTRAIDLGDHAWRELLAAHDHDVATHVARFGGKEMKHPGSGSLAVFDGPARAIEATRGIMDGAERRGLSVRAGVHTGECEVGDGDVRGTAVNVGARVVELAATGELLATSTVRDLVAGSGIRFGEVRSVELPGIPGPRVVLPVLRHGASPQVVRQTAIDHANLFRLDGEYWTVGFRGQVVTLRDTKGLRDLARLLAEPGREFHVLDLMREAPPGRRASPGEVAANGLEVDGGEGIPVLDDAARSEYRRRIAELEDDVDDATARGDSEAAAMAREELDALVTELTAAYGLGGRARRSSDDVERARKAVSRRLRDALSRIDRVHSRLGRHLDASIRTGVFCSYEPERDTAWTVERGA